MIARTLAAIDALPPPDWDDLVPAAHLLRVAVGEGMLRFRPSGGWLRERPKGSWRFSHVINHGYRHLGEAYTICGLLGLPQVA